MSIQNGDDVQPGAWRIDYAGEARKRFLAAVEVFRDETVEVVLTDGSHFAATLVGATSDSVVVQKWLDENGEYTTTGYVPLFSEDGLALRGLYVY